MMRTGFIAALSLFGWIVLSPALPSVEGYLYPVTGQAAFTRVEDVRPGYTIIEGQLEKRRPCDFDAIAVYLGSITGGGARARITFLESAKTRPTGSFEFGPWEVQLTSEQLLTNSYAVVTHQCHALWPTRTVIWENQVDDLPS